MRYSKILNRSRYYKIIIYSKESMIRRGFHYFNCKCSEHLAIDVSKFNFNESIEIVHTEYKPLGKLSLIKNIALFSQLLMMREVEIVFWAALNTSEDIQQLIKEVKEKGHHEGCESLVI